MRRFSYILLLLCLHACSGCNPDKSSAPDLAEPAHNCDESRQVLDLNEYTFVPAHTKGDKDFEGHGPKVRCSVKFVLNNKNNTIDMEVYMMAEQTEGDGTTAKQKKVVRVLRAPPDLKIVRIEGITRSEREYIDTDYDEDTYDETGQQPVRRFKFKGDTVGSEAGTKTQVILELNKLVYFTKSKKCD